MAAALPIFDEITIADSSSHPTLGQMLLTNARPRFGETIAQPVYMSGAAAYF